MLKTVGFPSTRTGDQTIVNGNQVFATAGKGVDFSANPNAPGMTSELLNWYEEGTWTPILVNWTVSGAATISGTYTRVGRLVTFFAYVAHATSTATIAGTSYIWGLPFTPSAESACMAASTATDLGYGTGSVGTSSGDTIYPPTFSVGAGITVVVTGTYYV